MYRCRLGLRTEYLDLHRDRLDHVIASAELANDGDRAFSIDRPPPT